jgi:hypothetical protein
MGQRFLNETTRLFLLERKKASAMSALIEDVEVTCPYCGEPMEIDVDCTGGSQVYYEDCRVCCAPITLLIGIDELGDLIDVKARREDD